MKTKPHDERDSMKVWLAAAEADQLLEAVGDTEHRLAIGLMLRSGLRAAEVVDVLPTDITPTPAGPRVTVREGKGGKYRQTPLPRSLLDTARAYADGREADQATPLVARSTKTVRRWVGRYADELADETGVDDWRHLSPHDLRRTWGTLLLSDEVLPHVVMDWGGWEHWETFREHYLGAASPEVERREAAKVGWL